MNGPPYKMVLTRREFLMNNKPLLQSLWKNLSTSNSLLSATSVLIPIMPIAPETNVSLENVPCTHYAEFGKS